jgi:hypothetical protein
VGEHPHTLEERIQKHSVVERAKLVALALVELPELTALGLTDIN